MGLPLFAPRQPLTGDGLPPNPRAPRVMGAGAVTYAKGREIAALTLWVGAVFLCLAFASFRADTLDLGVAGPNWVGVVGEAFARMLVSCIGVVAWAMPIELVLLGVPFVRNRKSLISAQRLAGDLLILLLAASMVQVGWPGAKSFGNCGASGLVGELFGEVMRSLFSTVGSFVVGVALLGLILISRAAFSFIALMRWFGALGKQSARKTAAGARSVADAWRTAREVERAQDAADALAARPRVNAEGGDHAVIATAGEDEAAFVDAAAYVADESHEFSAAPPPVAPAVRVAGIAGALAPLHVECTESDSEKTTGPRPRCADHSQRPDGGQSRAQAAAAKLLDETPAELHEITLVDAPVQGPGPAAGTAPQATAGLLQEPVANAAPEGVPTAAEVALAATERRKKGGLADGPTIVDTSAALQKAPTAPTPKRAEKGRAKGFELPSLDFLASAQVDPTFVVDKDVLFKNAELLIKTLADYGVSGKVEEILPGPTVTTYEVSPASGTKVSKVASLADDLALALARKVRIIAPIPGKNRIGFELPNERRQAVNFRDLVEDQRFQNLDVPLPVVMGRDIVGNPVYADLSSMPHVIVAGATGAGKSVGLNVMLTSLLYRRTPEELRLLMIDPKVVELAPFDRIPHMLLPVVTDMKQAANALKWAVDEMERRYQLFADAGTKNITTYNGWAERVIRGEIKNPFPKKVMGKDHNGFVDAVACGEGEEGEAPLPEKMPSIVLVVDEFADLMMQQGKEVEVSVARLAQKARAAGMHVILATQRPSVDVITGMIKANFPTRIAFRVAQKVDSRTILDEQGAEHLLGRGDMLVRLNGTNDTKRVQCPWVSEEEVQQVTDFLRAQGEPVYDENILKPRDDEGAVVEEDAEQDAMYDDAVRIVAETRRCSTSWLQRKLGLGYNRAARIVEMMERRGIVGGANGSKDREVLLSPI